LSGLAVSTDPASAASPAAHILRSPAALLLMVGALLGLNFPLGKLGGGAGVAPLVWAALISCGAAFVLMVTLALRRKPVALSAQHLRYFCVTALISYAVPNALVFAAIPHLGSAYAAMLFTLSPMFTVALSFLAKLRVPKKLELTGIGIGFIGTILVASARGEVGHVVDWTWIAIGVLVPLSLAIGNIYRTIDMPKNADTLVLAAGSNVVAAVLLVALAGATGDLASVPILATIPTMVLAQVAAAAAMFPLYFQLQAVGGPVTLSQIGIVAAAVGVIAGTLGFGERYPAIVWIGIAIIAIGISLTVRARLRA
jgi:drug/metabolite transporter (DMT)-like permease